MKLVRLKFCTFLFGGIVLPLVVMAAGPVPFQPSNPLPAPSNPPLKQIEPGVFELGKVRLNKNSRTVSFPAIVNMDQGIIEYLFVHGSGKIHESLLRTDVEPYHVHLAVLLISDKHASNALPTPSAISNAKNVRLSISWKKNDKEIRVLAEDVIRDLHT